MGEGVIGYGEGRKSQRAHHRNNLPDSYASPTLPPPQYNFLYPGLVQDVKVDSVFTLAVTLRLVSLGFLSHEDLNLFYSHADLHIHTFTLVCANVDTQTHTRCYFRL